MILKNILLWAWQLPQNLLGFILSRFCKKQDYVYNYQITYYTGRFMLGSAISLGDYRIFDARYVFSLNAYLHELGHSEQSLRLGWLYLIIIGLPSITFNAYDRLFHKKWTISKRCNWYYNLFWEKWADKLGGVKR